MRVVVKLTAQNLTDAPKRQVRSDKHHSKHNPPQFYELLLCRYNWLLLREHCKERLDGAR